MTELLIMACVFIVTCTAGYLLISRVPSLLHTPLMSMTNALSAVTIVGALILFSKDLSVMEKVLSAIAMVAASFNLFGGYLVTHRMLRMFKTRNTDG